MQKSRGPQLQKVIPSRHPSVTLFSRLLPAPVNDSLELPFGFNLSIGKIQNDFMITKNGNPVAGLSTVKLHLYQ